jgi:hypothetical protein
MLVSEFLLGVFAILLCSVSAPPVKNCPSARCASTASAVCSDDHVFISRNFLLRRLLQDSLLYIIVLVLHVYFSHFHLYVSNIIIIIIIVVIITFCITIITLVPT